MFLPKKNLILSQKLIFLVPTILLTVSFFLKFLEQIKPSGILGVTPIVILEPSIFSVPTRVIGYPNLFSKWFQRLLTFSSSVLYRPSGNLPSVRTVLTPYLLVCSGSSYLVIPSNSVNLSSTSSKSEVKIINLESYCNLTIV